MGKKLISGILEVIVNQIIFGNLVLYTFTEYRLTNYKLKKGSLVWGNVRNVIQELDPIIPRSILLVR